VSFNPENFAAHENGDNAPPSTNPAVARCCDAGTRAYRTALAKQKSEYSATNAANEAYRLAMPPLDKLENISDFIACVAHGMLIGSIGCEQGARLLYAAQVANSVHRNTRSQAKKTTST
jgi:hypothetical protein